MKCLPENNVSRLKLPTPEPVEPPLRQSLWTEKIVEGPSHQVARVFHDVEGIAGYLMTPAP
jgi:hypothetical protein